MPQLGPRLSLRCRSRSRTLELVGVLIDVRAAFLGSACTSAPSPHRPRRTGLVLQLLQRRVHRTRARPTVWGGTRLGARADLMDDLVAVPGCPSARGRGSRPHVSATDPPGPGRRTSAARTARRASDSTAAAPDPGPGPGPPRVRAHPVPPRVIGISQASLCIAMSPSCVSRSFSIM